MFVTLFAESLFFLYLRKKYVISMKKISLALIAILATFFVSCSNEKVYHASDFGIICMLICGMGPFIKEGFWCCEATVLSDP